MLIGLFTDCLPDINPAGDRQLSEKGISLEASAMVSNQKAIYCEDKDVYRIIIRPCSVHRGLYPPQQDVIIYILGTLDAALHLLPWN